MPGPQARSAHLLHADEEQLDRAAIAIGSGRAFVVAVCPPELRTEALGRLRGRVKGLALLEPVEVGSPEEMLEALVEQVERRDRVLSLTLGRDVMGALDGLNLHREKVLRGGPVVLWLSDVDTLVKMRERAPDAFSFRSTMVLVRGDGGALPVVKGEESEAVLLAKKRLKRARTPVERAGAGQSLAEHLRERLKFREAEAAARAAFKEAAAADTAESHRLRVRICRTMALIAGETGMKAQELHWNTRALAENMYLPQAQGIENDAMIHATYPGPFFGPDRAAVQKAVGMTQSYGLGPEVRSQALRAAVVISTVMGNLRAAREYAREWRSFERYVTALDRSSALSTFAWVDKEAGNLAAAESGAREGAAADVTEGGSPAYAFVLLCGCLVERGEIDAASSVVSTLASGSDLLSHVQACRVSIELERGDVAGSLVTLHEAVRQAEARYSDGFLVSLLEQFVLVVEQGSESEHVSAEEIVAAQAHVGRGETLVLALAGPDGPAWYPIELLSLRARLLALTPSTLSQALDLSRQALDLARSTYLDLLPETARRLVDLLLRAHQYDEALAVITDVEPLAAREGFLKERARLIADRALALVQRGDPPSAVEPVVAALREALAATDSPRITAETLRDLAKRLPPTTTTPDPHALAEEAHALFLAMPMPAEDARCLEITADVLVARGQRDEAKRRYLAARARLQRYGLGLRLPLLNRKLDALA